MFVIFPVTESHGPNRRGETWAPQQDAQNGKGNGGGNFMKKSEKILYCFEYFLCINFINILQVFERKVKEKQRKLKDSETDLERRHKESMEKLEQQKRELEARISAFTQVNYLFSKFFCGFLNPNYYSCQIFQEVRLFQGGRLFRSLEFRLLNRPSSY